MYQKKNKKKQHTSSICQNMMKFQSETVLIISHFQTLFGFKHGERLPQHFLHGLHYEHIPLPGQKCKFQMCHILNSS